MWAGGWAAQRRKHCGSGAGDTSHLTPMVSPSLPYCATVYCTTTRPSPLGTWGQNSQKPPKTGNNPCFTIVVAHTELARTYIQYVWHAYKLLATCWWVLYCTTAWKQTRTLHHPIYSRDRKQTRNQSIWSTKEAKSYQKLTDFLYVPVYCKYV